MRRALAVATVAAIAIALAIGSAHRAAADPTAADKATAKSPAATTMGGLHKPKPIDVTPMLDKLEVFRDDLGHFYVSPVGGLEIASVSDWLFYGDGKTMYQQRVIGLSNGPKQGYEWSVWSPRVRNATTATINLAADIMTVTCRPRSEEGARKLTQLKADEAKVMLKRGVFLPPLWQRSARFLARDDEGVYYFVDMLREEYGGLGYRLFVGQAGAMKELATTNIVDDSAGQIYVTKSGSLKNSIGKEPKALWIKGGVKTELTVLEPGDNRYLIYRELGLYGALGTVCDDM